MLAIDTVLSFPMRSAILRVLSVLLTAATGVHLPVIFE
jgi:hypothetical protein